MTLKKVAGKLHLWLGFVAGLVVLVSMLASAVFVWEKELSEWYHHEKLFVREIKEKRLPFDKLLEKAKEVSVANSITSVNIERDPSKAYVFGNHKVAANPGWTWASGLEDYSRIYVDQFTGEVLGTIDLRYDWIYNMRMLHQCLLLNRDVGHYIVGSATLIIAIMVITGIILWWPKNKAAFKQRIWFRWKETTKWRRKNYDLHNICGIYSFVFILFFAFTGLVWTFDWWEDGIYRMLGNDPKKVFQRAPPPVAGGSEITGKFEFIVNDIMNRVPNWRSIGLNIPAQGENKKERDISAFVRYSSGNSGWDESNNYSYHPKTGQLYFSTTHDQKTLGAKWRNSNYAMHVGSIYGLPTKLLATFIGLFCASLPVTGFYVWWGRRKKKRRVRLTISSGRLQPV